MTNKEIIETLDAIKSLCLSAATYGCSEEREYKDLRKKLIECDLIKSEIPLLIKSNHSLYEVRTYMQGLYGTYAERRNFITAKINELIEKLESEYFTNGLDFLRTEKTGWELIDESVTILKSMLDSISDRISINEIGVRCRETIILLAKQVYVDETHHPKDYSGVISPTDAKRKFDGYFDYYFPGSCNDEKRRYAKTCNDLANQLTHSNNLSKLDAKIAIAATLSLINIIKLIDSNKQ